MFRKLIATVDKHENLFFTFVVGLLLCGVVDYATDIILRVIQ